MNTKQQIASEDCTLDLYSAWRGSGRVRSTWPKNFILEVARKLSDPQITILKTLNFKDIEYALEHYCTNIGRQAVYARYRDNLTARDIAAVNEKSVNAIYDAIDDSAFMCKAYLLYIRTATDHGMTSTYLLYPMISRHTIYILQRNHIYTIEQLKDRSETELQAMSYIGPKIAKDIKKAVKKYYENKFILSKE